MHLAMDSNSGTMNPHIIALPLQIEGHINPFLHLCKRLADLGCKITFLNSEITHKLRFASALPIHPLITFVPISDGFSTMPVGRQMEDSINNLGVSFQHFIQDLVNQGIQISCIISDTFLPWSQDVADTGSAAADMMPYSLPRLIQEGHVPVKGPSGQIVKDELIDFIPGMSLKPTDLPIAFFTQGPKIETIRRGYETLAKAKYILSSTFEELETDRVKAMREILLKTPNYVPVGPLLPSSFLDLEGKEDEISISDKKCLEWLEKQKALSVLYVSFGSMATLSAKQVEELWKALEASRQPFLLVMRSGLAVELAADIYQAFLSSTQNLGLVVDWCPQMRVLAHKAVGGFLSHCGWNSTMESICAGVPMIGWPSTSEQNFNIKFMVEDWGIAISLWNGENDRFVGREEIEECIEKLMKGHEGKLLRERALNLQEAARKSVSKNGSSYTNLCQFIEAMSHNG